MSGLYKSSISKMAAKKPAAKKPAVKAGNVKKAPVKATGTGGYKVSAVKKKPIADNISITANDKSKNKTKRKKCAAIRSPEESHLRCLMLTKNGEKYCSIHLSQKNIVDFNLIDDDIIERDEQILKPTKIVTNSIIRKMCLSESDKSKQPVTKQVTPVKRSCATKTMFEQKVSTIENSYKENEDDLEIKLLILVNDDEYCDKISDLIGPVFQNITVSEDQQDPITFDEIWTIKDGIKVPALVNKYYLFSYVDLKDKIRCLTVFTIYNMINDNNFIHPITMEQIPDKDIERAKELINLYQTKIGLFKEDESNLSSEFKLKNRLTKLFKQFHIHSIYFEENWLLSIDDKTKLYKIIKETEKLVSNNIKTINANLHGFKIFQKKEMIWKGKGKMPASKSKNDDDSIFALQEYIVTEWERLIQAADNPQNQIPIWIMAMGLSFVVTDVKQKYPDLEIML